MGVDSSGKNALPVYPEAEIEVREHGIVLQPSAPPAPPRGLVYLQRPARR